MPSHAEPHPPNLVVMGVSGTGKTTLARLLAARLDVPFADADDFHPPANIAKMSSGIPLDDADREPWLKEIARRLHHNDTAGTGGVIACSALKRRYRDVLRSTGTDVFFLHLTADRELLASRLTHRTGHFMPRLLLDSQLAVLEPLEPDERGATLDTARTSAETVDAAVELLPRAWARGGPGAAGGPEGMG